MELKKQGIYILFAAALPLYAAALSVAEKKAVRREMIELDIAVRNFASIVATGDKKMLEDTLDRLVSWQIKDHPEHGKVFREVLSKWETSGALKFGQKIHVEASAVKSFVQSRGKFTDADWARVDQGFLKILHACQGCHEMTYKKEHK